MRRDTLLSTDDSWGPPPEEPPPGEYEAYAPPDDYFGDDVPQPPDPYDDVPPMEEPDDEAYSGRSSSKGGNGRRFSKESKVDPEMSAYVLDTLRRVFASLHRKPTSDCVATVQNVMSNPKVLSFLSEETQDAYQGVFEVLLHECVNNEAGSLNLEFLPVVREYDANVSAEVLAITSFVPHADKEAAASLWQALRESVQRHYSRSAAQEYQDLLNAQATVEKLMDAYRKIVDEPPTARKALTANKPVKNAREIAAEQRALSASMPSMRFSSGYRTLDLVFTGKGQPVGFLAPGEQAVVAGMTGTGKSSFSYGLVVGCTWDLINWGFPDAFVLWFHTEEESSDKIHAAGFDEGQRYHSLSKNVIVDAVGTSRRRMCEVIYLLTQKAEQLSKETGRAIEQFLPHICLIDYIQSLTSEKAGDPVKESIITAELILRGFQAWNFEEMAKWGGVSYQEFIGESVPAGMDHHRMAVVTFAQLNKQDDRLMAFKLDSGKDHPMTDFSMEDGRPGEVGAPDGPEWRDEQGTGWTWEVREGDSRILRQNAISGSSVILKNATTILFLHRSRPYNNPEAKVNGVGTGHLEDTRARLIPDKTRTGSRMKYVPMAFDIDLEGFRARYFDRRAEAAIEEGVFTPDQAWQGPGDPILPVRPRPRPLAGVRY